MSWTQKFEEWKGRNLELDYCSTNWLNVLMSSAVAQPCRVFSRQADWHKILQAGVAKAKEERPPPLEPNMEQVTARQVHASRQPCLLAKTADTHTQLKGPGVTWPMTSPGCRERTSGTKTMEINGWTGWDVWSGVLTRAPSFILALFFCKH